MQSISISELRGNIKKHLDAVTDSRDILVVPRASEEDAVVIMSLQDYNSLNETAYLLSSPANAIHLQQSIEQYGRGEGVKISLDDVWK